ncbi:hypothetical protein [Bradyrhizobium cenepequi]|uniref:hypothetical protein n=1 Tax=Bradyrhizobium cenepequi TaxID=2821403 RepID=UPI001CE374F6|nr:hypothetical protein [Bradyrhizobium cenepequi]MCA6111113.1 hypothetical protein [Bradyrhizobium cenepequi]
MIGLLYFVLAVLVSPFKSKMRLEAENAALRHQLTILRRRLPGRIQFANSDRWFFVRLYRWFPSILQVLTIIRPETLVRWHRAGFRRYWRWKSRSLGRAAADRGGAARVDPADERREPTLGRAPRLHRELLKLGFEVAQSSVEAGQVFGAAAVS